MEIGREMEGDRVMEGGERGGKWWWREGRRGEGLREGSSDGDS